MRRVILQRRLSGATATPLYVATDAHNSPAARVVIQRKGHSAKYRAATSRELRNRLTSAEMRITKSSKMLRVAKSIKYRSSLRRVAHLAMIKHKLRIYGFLNKNQQVTVRLSPPSSTLYATYALERKRLQYRELKFYNNRPRLRLPELAMTRSRKRKAGLVTFVRDSLRHTRSFLGQVRTLLPPANVYRSTAIKQSLAFSSTASTLTAYTRRDDLLPIF